MSITAKIVLDSIGPNGIRLVTFDVVYPRFILAEVNTHRAFSRNSASSRAIPAKKFRERVMADPAVPVHWGLNKAGMQADLEIGDTESARNWWLRGLELMERHHVEGESRGLHKQVTNRVLDTFLCVESIITADQYGLANMFHTRRHPAAQPEFNALATAMADALRASIPQILSFDQWHLPMIKKEDVQQVRSLALNQDHELDLLKAISVGRCARVSYLNHEGKRSVLDDIRLHDKLIEPTKNGEPGHFSPFEHVARPCYRAHRDCNFTGWTQYRKQFNGNDNMMEMPDDLKLSAEFLRKLPLY